MKTTSQPILAHVHAAFAGLLLPLLLLLPGCLSTPGPEEMRDLRASSAQARIEALGERQPYAGRAFYLSGPLSLEDALARALDFSLALRQELLGRETASAKIQAAYQNVLPSLSASASYRRFDDDLASVADDGTSRPGRFLDQYDASLTLSQPLFSGRIGAAIRASHLTREWTETRIRAAEEQVRFDVQAAYFNAILSQHLFDVKSTSFETAQRQLDETTLRRRQGMASNYDHLRATVEVSNSKAALLQAQNDLDLAFTGLFRLIGASPDSQVTLTTPLPLVRETIAFDDALAVALASRADLATAEYAVRLQREAVVNARAATLPSLSAFFTGTLANPDPHDSASDDWGDEWRAGVNATWTLFDGLATRGAVREAQASLRQLELALQDAEEAVVSEIRQRVLALRTAEEFADSQSQNLDTAREALRLVEVGLREGQNTQVEVMDAREALTTASANYYRSIYDHVLTRLALRKAMGTLADAPLPDHPLLSPVRLGLSPALPALPSQQSQESQASQDPLP